MSSSNYKPPGCHLTVLRSYGPRLAKRVTQLPNGSIHIEGYERAKTFRPFNIPVQDADGIAGWLERHQDNRLLAVIRAKLLAGIAPDRVRRTLHEKPDQDGGSVPQYFEPEPKRWVAIDLDGINLPAGLDQKRELVGYLVSLLPPEVAGVDLVMQMTGSAGFKPGVRARLWFWLDRPTSGDELQRWFKGCPVDLSTFRDVQSESGMASIIERFTEPGDTVLDPFCGGGTTGLAACRLSRHFIGADLDPGSVQTSLERMEAATRCDG